MEDDRPLSAQPIQGPGHHLNQIAFESTDHLARGPQGIHQGPQQVKHGAHLQGLANGRDGLHGWMPTGRKQKRDPHLMRRRLDLGRICAEANSQRLQHIGGSRLAGSGPVPMLHHRDPSGGGHKGDGRGNVEGGSPVATRAASVDRGAGQRIARHAHRLAQQNLGHPSQLISRYPLGLESSQNCARQGRSQPIIQPSLHQLGGLSLGQGGSIEQLLQQGGPIKGRGGGSHNRSSRGDRARKSSARILSALKIPGPQAENQPTNPPCLRAG